MIKEEIILGKINDINQFLDELDVVNDFPLVAADRCSDCKRYLFEEDYLDWYKAICNGNLVALVCLRHDNYKCDNSTHLSLFEVKKSFRGKYIGTEVIDELKNTITSKGRIFTTSGIDMYEEKRPITENFYMRLGFKELTLEDGTKYLKYTA